MNRRDNQETHWGSWGTYEFIKPAVLWLKSNFISVAICLCLGFAFGYDWSQSQLELDCKYAKAVRLNSNAFKCERLI